MPCSCEKPDKGGKCFPEKIVERPILFRLVKIASTIGDETAYPPTVGLYRNVLLNYEVNNHSYMYSSDGIPVFLETSIPQSIYDDLNNLQQEIDDLKNSPDVVDIVATYADLQAYDTQHLGDNDIVRVLQDETHDGDSSFYRWDAANSSWVYIGSTPPAQKTFYADSAETGGTRHIYANSDMTGAVSAQTVFDASTKGLVILRMSTAYSPTSYNDTYLVNAYVDTSNNDFQLIFSDGIWTYGYDTNNLSNTVFDFSKSQYQQKLTAGANITITGNSISATDTTYSNFVGTDGVDHGSAGLVPAPATTDVGKVLGSNGNWVAGGPTVVQTKGASIDDVMSQGAVTDLIYSDDDYYNQIAIGGQVGSSSSGHAGSTAIGVDSKAGTTKTGSYATAVGYNAAAGGQYGTSIGANTLTAADGIGKTDGGVSLGAYASCNGTAIAIGGGTKHGSFTNVNDITAAARTNGAGGVAIGVGSRVTTNSGHQGSIAIGAGATVFNKTGVMQIGTFDTSYGYNTSNYRLLTGVYDGQDAHDAATKGQLDAAVVNGGTTAPTTATVGSVGTLYSCVNSGTPEVYMCTAVSGGTYTWTKVI